MISAAQPSLRQLTYLLALHEHRHFGRAGAACFVTQSALSAAMAELERLLGTVLVERSKRSVRFTPVGEEVVARARAIIRATDDLCAAAEDARGPLAGPLRLAVIPTIAPFLLPPILAALPPAWPRLKLSVREMLTGTACDGLQRGSIDCALMALPAPCGEVESVEIAVDRLMLARPASEGAVDEPIGVEAIDTERLLLLEDGHCLRDHALAACNLKGASDNAPLVVATLQTMVQLVAAGLGITLLPEMAVAAGLLNGTGLMTAPVQGLNAVRHIALVWRANHLRREEFALLGEFVRGVVAAANSPPLAAVPADEAAGG